MKKKEAIFYEGNSFPSPGPDILELKADNKGSVMEASLEKEAEERRIKEKKSEEERKAKKAKELRIERSKEAALRERNRIYWTDAHTQGRWRSIHSEEYQSRYKKKKYEYY